MTDEETVIADTATDATEQPETATEAPVETEEAAEPTAEAGEDKAEGADKEEGDKPKPKPKQTINERMAELTAHRREAERREEAALQEVERLKKRIGTESPTPKEADFASFEEYQAALTAHHVSQHNQRERAEDLKDAQSRAEQSTGQLSQAKRAAFDARVLDFVQQAPDFHQVFTDSVPVTESMAEIITDSDQGPQIAYWLGNNTGDAARIAQMTNPRDVAREIGKIEGRLSTPPPKRTTQAPDPVGAVATGAGSKQAFDLAKASDDQVSKQLERLGVIQK